MTLGLGRYRLYQHNVWHTLSSRAEFHLFSKRSKHCQNNLHFQLKLSFIDHAANIFGPRSVSQAKSILFSDFCHIHGTWVPQKILNAYAKLDQVAQDGVRVCCKLFEISQLSENELYTLEVSFYFFETSPVFVCHLYLRHNFCIFC